MNIDPIELRAHVEIVYEPIDDYVVETAAAACHQTNWAYCVALGDDSQKPWHEADPWQRASARNGVRNLMDNPDCTPEEIHANWLHEKLEQGWVYGPVKDVQAKTHPCCVPYSDLPEEQRRKDDLFLRTARTILGLMRARIDDAAA